MGPFRKSGVSASLSLLSGKVTEASEDNAQAGKDLLSAAFSTADVMTAASLRASCRMETAPPKAKCREESDALSGRSPWGKEELEEKGKKGTCSISSMDTSFHLSTPS